MQSKRPESALSAAGLPTNVSSLQKPIDMKKTVILSIIASLLMAILPSCQDQESITDLFSGTLPVMELGQEDVSGYSEAKSLFVRLMGEQVEFEGQVYPLELLSEDEFTIRFKTSLPLAPGIQANALVYEKTRVELLLEIEGRDKSIRLEQFDEMLTRKANEFVTVDLSADISHLSEHQKQLLPLLFKAADIMEDIYWSQVFPDKEAALSSLMSEDAERFFRINYGPWERLNGNLPFLPDYGEKPAGSGYYPADMSKEEFEALDDPSKTSLYTLIQRDAQGKLISVPYHVAYEDQVKEAASYLREAAELAEDAGFKNYLELRAEALLSDEYLASDLAWMDMKENDIDFVVGPIENYEDALFNYKAAHEAFILIKDKQWSDKLAFIASVLPQMQRTLPVADAYKKEVPGSDSDLGAYDVVYYAGDCNAGSKTIAINLPNDPLVHAAKGSRKLQLKNAIRYKFEEILVPISNVLIDESQRGHITFDAFFENTMYHEVAHGLGINQTLDGKGTVREALTDQYSAMEEGKADILGLYLLTQMSEQGMLGKKDLMDNYVTFMASIFRSIRFGVASSHGKANMIRFYYFQEAGAFSRSNTNGTYKVDFEKMQKAMNDLANLILTIQGDGDYQAAKSLVEKQGFIREELQADLDRLEELSIPKDIVFNQGPELLGL
jgi:hypothetical protein